MSNLRDCTPFKAQHRDGLTPAQQEEWDRLIEEAAGLHGRNSGATIDKLREAAEIDDQHAGLHYLLAECYIASGQHDEAHASYIRAKEHDVCPLRIIEPMSDIILEVAQQTRTPLVDIHRLYEQISDGGIPGGKYLVDHVHPSIEGHQLIADQLAAELVRLGFVVPAADWSSRRDAAFREHIDSLDDLYYAKGAQRLDALRLWTRGKATRERPD